MTNFERYRSVQIECLAILLRPLVRFWLNRSQSFQDFAETAKMVFVEVAEAEMKKSTDKVNPSRISVTTGINRAEVVRFFHKDKTPIEKAPSVLGRVIGQWEQNKRFLTKTGRPKYLSYKGEASEFHSLVYSISAHLNPGTILFELERIGAVNKTEQSVKLESAHLSTANDPRATLEIVAGDMQSLLDAVLENIDRHKEKVKNHHHRTEYDNIYFKDIPAIRDWLWREGKLFHKRARDFISQFDKDVVPPPSLNDAEKTEWKAGAKVVLCGHSRVSFGEEPLSDAETF